MNQDLPNVQVMSAGIKREPLPLTPPGTMNNRKKQCSSVEVEHSFDGTDMEMNFVGQNALPPFQEPQQVPRQHQAQVSEEEYVEHITNQVLIEMGIAEAADEKAVEAVRFIVQHVCRILSKECVLSFPIGNNTSQLLLAGNGGGDGPYSPTSSATQSVSSSKDKSFPAVIAAPNLATFATVALSLTTNAEGQKRLTRRNQQQLLQHGSNGSRSSEEESAGSESTSSSPTAMDLRRHDMKNKNEDAFIQTVDGLETTTTTHETTRRHPYTQIQQENYNGIENNSSNNINSGSSRTRKLISSPKLTTRNRSASDTSSASARRAVSRWTTEQDKALSEAVRKHNEQNWKAIASLVPGRDHVQCLQRWQKALKPGLVKGHWTKEEDEKLMQLVSSQGTQNWGAIAAQIPGRIAKQCRERWTLNLDPSINRSPWTQEEDEKLLALHESLGSKWAEIKNFFEGRTENAVKTRFKSLKRAKAKHTTPSGNNKK